MYYQKNDHQNYQKCVNSRGLVLNDNKNGNSCIPKYYKKDNKNKYQQCVKSVGHVSGSGYDNNCLPAYYKQETPRRYNQCVKSGGDVGFLNGQGYICTHSYL